MSKTTSGEIMNALNWRYAVKEFDSEKKVSDADIEALKESMVLTPSSFGLQPWRFVFVSDQAVKDQMPGISWNQAQPKDCSHMVVLAYKKDYSRADVGTFIERMAEIRGVSVESLEGYEKFAGGFIDQASEQGWVDDWAGKQVYIALGQLMATAALLGVDACPMEGISPDDYDKLLGLDADGYRSVVGCALGYRSSGDKYAATEKVRYAMDNVIEEV